MPRFRSISPALAKRLPFVFINMSMSADGKIASANRAVTHFSSPRDSRHLYQLRATADAIMCGARTVEQSHTILGNGGEEFRRRRLRDGLAEYPVRVVVSGSGTISPEAEIWSKRFSPIVVLTTKRIGKTELDRLKNLADHVWIGGTRELDIRRSLAQLRREFGVKRLLCEGGGGVNDALIQAGLVDEIHLTLCPLLLGGRKAPTIADGIGAARLADAAKFKLRSVRKRDAELFLVYQRVSSATTDGGVGKLPRVEFTADEEEC